MIKYKVFDDIQGCNYNKICSIFSKIIRSFFVDDYFCNSKIGKSRDFIFNFLKLSNYQAEIHKSVKALFPPTSIKFLDCSTKKSIFYKIVSPKHSKFFSLFFRLSYIKRCKRK